MHSITESDGVPSDPYEVLCHMAALIIEGRTPVHACKAVTEGEEGDSAVTKSPKPYYEGPHCPNFVKLYNKESSTNLHKCSENSMTCIRFANLKQHLQHLHDKSVPIIIEVSLGPDCLCGELRSQSTLVSVTPSKRDIVLEQWTLTIHQKRGHEQSQMSVMNLYQAVRSLLHFSQLTAWYMRNNGMKPAHVNYRIGIPGDSTFFSAENFVNHDFPTADINKAISMKMSVRTMPRMESIPSVFCPQHSCGLSDGAQGVNQETKEYQRMSKEKKFNTVLSGKLGPDKSDELTDGTLPFKFQGKALKKQESMNSRISYFGSQPVKKSEAEEYLNAVPVDNHASKSKKSFARFEYFDNEKSYPPESLSHRALSRESSLMSLAKVAHYPGQQKLDAFSCSFFDSKFATPNPILMTALMGYGKDFACDTESEDKGEESLLKRLDSKYSNDVSSPPRKSNILDDRMQITCGIYGKHHCKCEFEEEGSDNSREEKSIRRPSSGKYRPEEPEVGKITNGKFKEIYVESSSPGGKTAKRSIQTGPDLPVKKKSLKSLANVTEKEKKVLAHAASIATRESASNTNSSSKLEVVEHKKEWLNAEVNVAKNSKETDTESEDEANVNPFMAAILRTTKKFRQPNQMPEKSDETRIVCDNSQNNLCDGEEDKKGDSCDCCTDVDKSDIFLNKFKLVGKERERKEGGSETKVVVESEANEAKRSPLKQSATPIVQLEQMKYLDLKLEPKNMSAVRNLSHLGSDCDNKPPEFLLRGLNKLKSLIERREFTGESEEGASSESYETGFTSYGTRTIPVPSAQDKLKFRRSLDSAAQLVFHRCSGLPLTSSPAPVRRNNSSFSFDSSLNSVSAIKSALFDSANSISSEDENESEGSLRSPASPGPWSIGSKAINYHSVSPLPLLGTFEESVLNGRLEPVSTVQGFTAELGASGSFCPRHLHLPVTVFFYTLGDNDKVSAPYLGHINLGKKGYNVPRSGTIQVTLFNPLRTVVKMFVVVYDLHDMPPNSHTFLRQRTLYVPANQKESVFFDKKEESEDYHKYLRYLIHLRFISGKTGRIYLHTDIRMVIFRKADEDTATALGKQVDGETFELRSHTHGPTNPKFSPRK